MICLRSLPPEEEEEENQEFEEVADFPEGFGGPPPEPLRQEQLAGSVQVTFSSFVFM